MKYLVVSDTHTYINNVINLIEKIKPDYCIHLGDMASDCEDLESIFPRQKFIFVKGNNDIWLRDNRFPDEREFTLEGKRFFICHGHKLHVKESTELLKKAARQKNADIVLYGHTHKKALEWNGSMLVMNPGTRDSYGIIEIKDDNVKADVFDYEK